MINFDSKTKYTINYTTSFKKQFKKVVAQGKDVNKFQEVVYKLANKEPLESKYKDHSLINDKFYKAVESVIWNQIGY